MKWMEKTSGLCYYYFLRHRTTTGAIVIEKWRHIKCKNKKKEEERKKNRENLIRHCFLSGIEMFDGNGEDDAYVFTLPILRIYLTWARDVLNNYVLSCIWSLTHHFSYTQTSNYSLTHRSMSSSLLNSSDRKIKKGRGKKKAITYREKDRLVLERH